MRTEFLYMNREDLPDEEEQYQAYAGLVRGMEGRPVTLRTLDIGGDKLAAPLAEAFEGEGANPAWACAPSGLSLKERGLLDAQLAAMLRAGGAGPGAHPAADDLERGRGSRRARGAGFRSRAA